MSNKKQGAAPIGAIFMVVMFIVILIMVSVIIGVILANRITAEVPEVVNAMLLMGGI